MSNKDKSAPATAAPKEDTKAAMANAAKPVDNMEHGQPQRGGRFFVKKGTTDPVLVEGRPEKKPATDAPVDTGKQ